VGWFLGETSPKYKTMFKKMFGNIQIVLAEVECILNSRPLCHIYDENVDEVITPSHFLFGRRLSSTPENSRIQEL